MSDTADDNREEEEEEGFLGSIGFMFDAQHVRLTKTVSFGQDITLHLKFIGEDPGKHIIYGNSICCSDVITFHVLYCLIATDFLNYLLPLGHVQSGQYLWPAAAFTGQYLVDNWDTLKANTIVELGAGVGLAGLVASKLPGTEIVVLTDYDHGSLQLLNDNIELNKSKDEICKISVEFLEWGNKLKYEKEATNSDSTIDASSNDLKNGLVNDGSINQITDNHSSSSSYSASGSSRSSSTGSSSGSNDDSSRNNDKNGTFALVLGTDLLYCTEIVRPLFKSAKLLMDGSNNCRFILVSSFNPGDDIEIIKNICCEELGLDRIEIIKLDEDNKMCRVEYFTLQLPLKT